MISLKCVTLCLLNEQNVHVSYGRMLTWEFY